MSRGFCRRIVLGLIFGIDSLEGLKGWFGELQVKKMVVEVLKRGEEFERHVTSFDWMHCYYLSIFLSPQITQDCRRHFRRHSAGHSG
jgi:hypothetical protein